MRNRAKCKICKSIIESYANFDYVTCNCGEIAISGGSQKYECYANNFSNLLRIDDNDNEIVPTVIEKKSDNNAVIEKWKEDLIEIEENQKSKREKLLDELELMIKSFENLPQQAMLVPVTHADYCSLLMLIQAILRAG